MPTLNRAPNEKEVQKIISIYLKAETEKPETGKVIVGWKK